MRSTLQKPSTSCSVHSTVKLIVSFSSTDQRASMKPPTVPSPSSITWLPSGGSPVDSCAVLALAPHRHPVFAVEREIDVLAVEEALHGEVRLIALPTVDRRLRRFVRGTSGEKAASEQEKE